MRFKFLPNNLKRQFNSIFNKNERLATNVVDSTPSSTFDMSSRHITTFNSGYLVPVFCKEVLPGDIWDIDVSTVLRLSTPTTATMESAQYDIMFFAVPNRLVYENWKYFMGENKSAGFQKEYKKLPTINYDVSFKYKENDLASYLGFPVNVDMSKINVPVNSLYFKAYGKIWNDFFRDENLQSEIEITNNNKNDENVSVSDYKDNDYNVSIQIGQGLAPVSRLSDYFSTCLPYPQKGDVVDINSLPLNNLVVSGSVVNDENKTKLFSPSWYTNNGSSFPNKSGANYSNLAISSGSSTVGTGDNVSDVGLVKPYIKYDEAETTNLSLKLDQNTKISVDGNFQAYNINDLRLAIAVQHIRELDARGGTRYTEILLNHFGIAVSDARLQRAELIGGFKNNVNISNVVQSSATQQGSPLGLLGGVSVSGSVSPRTISYAAEEHSIIMGFVIVRAAITYSQGLDKQFTRCEKIDYYEPLLAHIGEQPVYKYELFLDDSEGESNKNNEIFGFNEPWADYRYSKNIASGYLSVNSDLSLASLYTYTEKYNNAPVLGDQWIKANEKAIGDTLLLDNTKMEYVNQFLGDFFFKVKTTRKMPVYGVPGIHKV